MVALGPSTGEGKGVRLAPGAHWTQVKDQPHEDECLSKSPCIIFLFNRDPYETKFARSSRRVETRLALVGTHLYLAAALAPAATLSHLGRVPVGE